MGIRTHVALIPALMLVTALTPSLSGQSEDPGHTGGFNYDRIELIGEFLKAAYPDLTEADGMLTLTAVFPHSATINITFRRCRPGSGVSPQPHMRGDRPTPPPLPSCGDTFPSGKDSFLSATIRLGTDENRPIASFDAIGKFIIDPKLQSIRDKLKEKPHWADNEALEELHTSMPKYGPPRKNEFLAIIPIEAIRKVTGCKLRPESTEFVVRLWENLPPLLEWRVRGEAPGTETLRESDCWASFEPFQGRMTSMGGFTQR